MSVFNVERTLREALESLVSQTYTNWECIICDDGSTDSTWSILEAFVGKVSHPFTLLRNPENSGLAYSLNRCLRKCKGTYIARMDGDDISEPQRLASEVAFLETHPQYQLVGCQMTRFDESGRHHVLSSAENPTPRNLIYGVPFFHATIMMRRTAYETLGGYDETVRRTEDYDLWFRFFKHGFHGYNLQIPLYCFRENLATIQRRTLANRWEFMVTQYKGYHLVGLPYWAYLWPAVNFMKVLVPSRLVLLYRRWQVLVNAWNRRFMG